MDTIERAAQVAVTLMIVGAYLWGFFHPLEYTQERLSIMHPVLLMLITFWFGEKPISQFLEKLGWRRSAKPGSTERGDEDAR